MPCAIDAPKRGGSAIIASPSPAAVSAYASFLRDNAKGRPTVGEFLQTHTPPQSVMAVVSAYFSVHAYDALRTQLDAKGSLETLFD